MSHEMDSSGLRRDYASDFGAGARGSMEANERHAQPATILAEPAEEPHKDLDTPAFLRRLRF
jgi:hypothetical protein